MEYIDDKDLFKAVMFARNMIRSGTKAPIANYRAAKYYDVDISDVAKYVGQVGNSVKSRRYYKK